jgi:hypothetical protein
MIDGKEKEMRIRYQYQKYRFRALPLNECVCCSMLIDMERNYRRIIIGHVIKKG